MQNPFTTTFSKIPHNSYIHTEQVDEIIENFSYDYPSESVYKITGVRGSGKTVLLAKVEEEFSSEENKNKGWIVCRLSPSRDMLTQLASMLAKESFIKKKSDKNVSVSATVLGTGGGIGISNKESKDFFDIGAELEVMLKKVAENGKKIIVGIDEVSKTEEMVIFASEFGKWLRAEYPIYLVCTGLYENIEKLSNVQNLTFFRRATTIKTEPLNFIKMTAIYSEKLKIDDEEAKNLATLTKGYPYAFQQLGVLFFKRNKDDSLETIIKKLKTELFAYAYEKIWEELTEEDRAMASVLINKDELKREEVVKLMKKPANYSVYRERLLKRGIITVRQSYMSLSLPFFGDYIKEFCI